MTALEIAVALAGLTCAGAVRVLLIATVALGAIAYLAACVLCALQTNTSKRSVTHA